MIRIALIGLFACTGAFAADPLPALDADLREVTMSGVSSGGYMAVQFHVAHSGMVKGAGVVAGGPYWCARGNVAAALANCMKPGWLTPLPAVELLKTEADRLALLKQVDPAANLSGAKVWLFSGSRDATVQPEVVAALGRFYALYGAKVVSVTDKPAGHGMVVEQAQVKCGDTAPPFINDCDYDAAGEMLRHIAGPLAPPAAKESGRLLQFDQKPFTAGAISMADTGYAFLPRSCESERCRVHVAFHGCRQNAGLVREQFVRGAGYNRWADANRLIVLYPQTMAVPGINPYACWDWWGYSGPLYHTKAGPQLRAVKAMLERLAAPRR